MDKPLLHVTAPDGKVLLTYTPTADQLKFHLASAPNLLFFGTRGTGKTLAARMDAHIRSLLFPGYKYAIVRRTIPELKRNMLQTIDAEMEGLKGKFNHQDGLATYPNGSLGYYVAVADEKATAKLLSSEFYCIYIDEAVYLDWSTIIKIAATIRVPKHSGLRGLLRLLTNPKGPCARELHDYFIAKNVSREENPDYFPDEYDAIYSDMHNNPHLDVDEYIKRFGPLDASDRRAWLKGQFVFGGAFFEDFTPALVDEDGNETAYHVIDSYPALSDAIIYRAVDWGWDPDPTVCLWIAVYPNRRAIVFKEQTWLKTTAKAIAEQIKSASAGMRVRDTFCDPTMFRDSAASDYNSIGDQFHTNGIYLTPSRNDRIAGPGAINQWLLETLDDKLPRLQIVSSTCPRLIETFPKMVSDSSDARKLKPTMANDHWIIALSYFCQGDVVAPQPYTPPAQYPHSWLNPFRNRWVLGRESIRSTR
jgi:hypothetical protein